MLFSYCSTVEACRERWKNLRAGLSRYLRQQSAEHLNGTKRPYYLAEYMQFLIPFATSLKKKHNGFIDREVTIPPEVEYGMELKAESPDEPPQYEDDEELQDTIARTAEPHAYYRTVGNIGKEYSNIRQRTIPDQSTPDVSIPKKRKLLTTVDDPDLCFFKSLLPDVRKMNDAQKHQFKMMVLNDIDDILYKTSCEPSRPIDRCDINHSNIT